MEEEHIFNASRLERRGVGVGHCPGKVSAHDADPGSGRPELGRLRREAREPR